MPRTALLALAIVSAPPLPFQAAAQSADYPGIYHPAPRALICRDAQALARLSAPGARETLGELAYNRLAEIGDCWPARRVTLKICGRFVSPVASAVYPVITPAIDGVVTDCKFMMNRDLLDSANRPFAP